MFVNKKVKAAEEVSTAMEQPDCLYPREVKRLIRSLQYIQQKNYDLHNGKRDKQICFQGIRERCISEIENLLFVLHVRRK